ERNGSLGSGQIMAQELRRGGVVIRAAAVWKEMAKRLGRQVQTCRIAGIGIERSELFEGGAFNRLDLAGGLRRCDPAIPSTPGVLTTQSTRETPWASPARPLRVRSRHRVPDAPPPTTARGRREPRDPMRRA